ncbi:hypothetical protein LMG33818_001240 [Halomonadaceae bacterium LMG 33818]|uniref:hypothetical protein n=1 Tax=Cernens ardua TaxID=3402176 RepID=UPI003EDB7B7B
MDYNGMLFLLIFVVLALGWGIKVSIQAYFRGRTMMSEANNEEIESALINYAEVNRQLLERLAKLDHMDERLARIEKTLDEIPS